MNSLKNLLFSVLAVASFTMSTQAQVLYSEDFQGLNGVMPAGMTLINNDGLTPNTAVAFVNNAWIVREELLAPNTDSCAMSTSWYTPAGTSDDWMITPLVNAVTATTDLSWEALAPDAAYADGYQVWVSTVAPTVAGMTAGTMVFSIAGEAQVWTSHTVSLAAFAGQNVYIGFRNNSNDKYILQVDDILVENIVPNTSDLAAVASTNEYTLIPANQAGAQACDAFISNPASSAVPDVVVNCNVYIAPNITTPVQSFTSTATSVAAGSVGQVTCGTYNYPVGTGTYVFEYIVSSATYADANAANDTFYAQTTINPEVYARDNGSVSNTIGVNGTSNTAFLGNNFEINTAATLDSVTFVTTGVGTAVAIGDTTRVHVFATAAGVPTGTPVASSGFYIYSAADTGQLIVITVAVGGATGYAIAPGVYNIALEEFSQTNNGGVAIASGVFTPNTTYAQINGGAWGTLEGLGFPNPVVIRPHVVIGCITPPTAATTVTSTFNGADVSCNGSTDGEATTVPVGGAMPYTYMWSANAAGQATAVATGLAAGMYYVTITDNASCEVVDSVMLTEPTAIVISNDTTIDVSCNGGADGEIQMTFTGGTTPYSYMWNNMATTEDLTGLTAGMYSGTITDANGCVDSGSIVVAEPTALAAAAVDNANGSATASGSGGTAPYTFMWDAAAANQTDATATGLINGNYSVTVTDANGCTSTASVTITGVAVNLVEGVNALNMFPNPTASNVFIDLDLTSSQEVSIRVANVTGQVVLENNLGTVETTRVELNTAELPTGIYMIHFNIGNETMTRKLVVNKQ